MLSTSKEVDIWKLNKERGFMTNCQHAPVAFGSGQVIWKDKESGTLFAHCQNCGEYLEWNITQ